MRRIVILLALSGCFGCVQPSRFIDADVQVPQLRVCCHLTYAESYTHGLEKGCPMLPFSLRYPPEHFEVCVMCDKYALILRKSDKKWFISEKGRDEWEQVGEPYTVYETASDRFKELIEAYSVNLCRLPRTRQSNVF